MFGMFGGAVPIDKESVRVITAFRYLESRESEERKSLLDERDEKIRGFSYESKEHKTINEEYKKRLAALDEKWKAKERALYRKVAGPLAKIIDG